MREKIMVEAKEAQRENSALKMQKTDSLRSINSPAHRIQYLQRTYGNQAIQRLLKSAALQAKLKIGQPGDIYEQEADRVAEYVVGMEEKERLPSLTSIPSSHLQREEKETEEPWYRVYAGTETNKSDDYIVAGISKKIGNVTNHRVELIKPGASYTPPKGWDLDCFIRRDSTARKFPGKLTYLGFESELTAEEVKSKFPQYIGEAVKLFNKNPRPIAVKEKQSVLQRFADRLQPSNDTSPVVSEVLRSGGHPLDNFTRAFMESRFDYDFSRVRVHTDAKAAEAVRAVNARAFTVGRDVVFGAGQYVPETDSGRHLLAHELTHIVQQNRGRTTVLFLLSRRIQRQATDQVASTLIQDSDAIQVMRASSMSLARQAAPTQKSPQIIIDYNSFSAPDGRMTDANAAMALIGNWQQLEQVYYDAAHNPRAARFIQDLEQTFAATGEDVANRTYSAQCSIPVVKELSKCIPNWSHLDFLRKDQPGAIRLRQVIADAYEQQARELHIRNEIIIQALNLLMAGTVVRGALRATSKEAAAMPPKAPPEVALPKIPSAPKLTRLEELSINPQTGKIDSKSLSEAQTILQAEQKGLVKNARRPDLKNGEPNLDFIIDGGYAEIKTPFDPAKAKPLSEQAKDIAKKIYDPNVSVIIDLKNLNPAQKAQFKTDLVSAGAKIEKVKFLNE